MPNPQKNESKSDFISRCIEQVIKEGTTNDSAQAAAICYTKWDEHKNNLDMEKKLKDIEFILTDENGNIVGDISAISIVSRPAVEISAQLFSSVKPEHFSITNEEKQLITSIALIPNRRILRVDENGEYYNCFFSNETVEIASQLFAKNGGYAYATVEHTPEKVRDIYVVESWIVGENDKIYSMGFSKEEVPVGSWAVTMKVDNKTMWSSIKEMKKLNSEMGFSIESIFASKEAFAEIDTVIEQTISNEGKEKIESPIEENIEKDTTPKAKSKKVLVQELIIDILGNNNINAEEKLKLINKMIGDF